MVGTSFFQNSPAVRYKHMNEGVTNEEEILGTIRRKMFDQFNEEFFREMFHRIESNPTELEFIHKPDSPILDILSNLKPVNSAY